MLGLSVQAARPHSLRSAGVTVIELLLLLFFPFFLCFVLYFLISGGNLARPLITLTLFCVHLFAVAVAVTHTHQRAEMNTFLMHFYFLSVEIISFTLTNLFFFLMFPPL